MIKAIGAKYNFTSGQRNGIVVLFVLIIILQLCYWFYDATSVRTISNEEKEWLALQTVIDSLKNNNKDFSIQPFNPNFISDYKGYKLGLSVQEINRLHSFRASNRYVNSAADFQKVTGVSDSLLNKLIPFFKFPNWVKQGNKKEYSFSNKYDDFKHKVIQKIDLNTAKIEDYKKVYGIGDALANRVVKFKERLGGFVSMEQLQEIWGLRPEVIEEMNKHFEVKSQPQLNLIDINNASVKELSQFYYFKYSIARQIIIYRSMYGDIKNSDDLIKIKDFPVEKAKIITLYLKY